MKKLFLFLFAGSLLLTGCLENTDEITLNEDGSGTYVATNDMSKALVVMKNMGMGDQMAGKNMDTSFALGNTNTEGLSAEDIAMLKKGNMKFKMNSEEEVLKSTMTFPFASLSDIPKINKLTSKSMTQLMMSKMEGQMPPGMDQMPEPSSIADYYTLEYENGEVKRKLNKEKQANIASDKYLAQLQQAGSMGIPITYTVVINLPKPAQKLEGKNAKLSDDKMKVTVKGDIDELFESPEKLEFKVKY